MDSRIVSGSTVHTEKSKIKNFADDIQLQQIHICEDNKKTKKSYKKKEPSLMVLNYQITQQGSPNPQIKGTIGGKMDKRTQI